jgi:hypothetical protein
MRPEADQLSLWTHRPLPDAASSKTSLKMMVIPLSIHTVFSDKEFSTLPIARTN